MLSYQIPDFVSAKADFGTDLAISTRTELDPGDTVGTLCNLITLDLFSRQNFSHKNLYCFLLCFISCMVATTWDKLLRAATNCHSNTKSDVLIFGM